MIEYNNTKETKIKERRWVKYHQNKNYREEHNTHYYSNSLGNVSIYEKIFYFWEYKSINNHKKCYHSEKNIPGKNIWE